MPGYLSIAHTKIHSLEVKKSIFIAAAASVTSEEEALAFVEERRQAEPSSRHHVYAYRVRSPLEGQLFQRYTDDGEPSGTAGLPVFDVLNKQKIENVVVVVSRIFGGILLGTGGLVHAYSQAARDVLNESQLVRIELCQRYELKIPYALFPVMEDRLKREGFYLAETEFAQQVTLYVEVTEAEEQGFLAMVVDVSKDQLRPLKKGMTERKLPLKKD